MPRSILEAVRNGFWDFEPPEVDCSEFDPADAMPGSDDKVRLLAERIRCGLPLWHIADRDDMEAPPPRRCPKRGTRRVGM